MELMNRVSWRRSWKKMTSLIKFLLQQHLVPTGSVMELSVNRAPHDSGINQMTFTCEWNGRLTFEPDTSGFTTGGGDM